MNEFEKEKRLIELDREKTKFKKDQFIKNEKICGGIINM